MTYKSSQFEKTGISFCEFVFLYIIFSTICVIWGVHDSFKSLPICRQVVLKTLSRYRKIGLILKKHYKVSNLFRRCQTKELELIEHVKSLDRTKSSAPRFACVTLQTVKVGTQTQHLFSGNALFTYPGYQITKFAHDISKTPLNVKMKPQPTKQQPQNPEALQEYFLSHKISQSLI